MTSLCLLASSPFLSMTLHDTLYILCIIAAFSLVLVFPTVFVWGFQLVLYLVQVITKKTDKNRRE